MHRTDALFSAAARVILHAAAIAALALTALVVIASFMRYLVGSPFDFTEELVALLYMAMVFLSIPISTLRRQHITVTLVSERVATVLRRPFVIVAVAVMIVFDTWFAIEAFDFTAFSYKIAARTEQVDILLWPWMALMPLAMGFGALIALPHLVQALRGDLPDATDQAPVGDKL